jgi:hypothetical protein
LAPEKPLEKRGTFFSEDAGSYLGPMIEARMS